MTTFDEAYSMLNKQQKEAVDTIEGPVLVVAGPGTGKTQILTVRIAHILNSTDVNPDNILALTFTENAARNMQERLVKFIGPTAYRVRIGTFHNFANEVIATFPEKFAFKKELKQITDLDKYKIIQALINTFDPSETYNKFEIPEKPRRYLLKPFNAPFLYQKEILGTIDTLKKENITEEKLTENINFEIDKLSDIQELNSKTKKQTGKWKDQIKLIQKNIELLDFYSKYNKELSENSLYDFTDMISFVLEEFQEDDELLAYYQEKFLYILVDEYQDTNGAQNELLKQLTSWDERPNLFVVGDDDQSIYRFQGANIQNILDFKNTFPTAKIINISQNYRSTQLVIDHARSIIKNNLQRLETNIENLTKDLKSNLLLNDTEISVGQFYRSDIEYNYIGEKISELIKNGASPDDIAVIYRTHRDGEEIMEFLLKKNVPINIIGNSNILDEEIVKKLILLCETILTPERSDLLGNVILYSFVDIPNIDAFKINRNCRDNSESQVADLMLSDEKLKEIGVSEIEKAKMFMMRIIEWGAYDQNSPFPQTFSKILEESGLNKYIVDSSEIDMLNSLKTLFDFVKARSIENKSYKLKNFIEDIRTLTEADISINKEGFKSKSSGVSLLTAHASKGLEYKYVFLPKLINGMWGNKRIYSKIKIAANWQNQNKQDDMEEERRLFFVALTRAKTHLFLSYSSKYLDQFEFKEKTQSQFLEELDKSGINYIDTKEYEDQAEEVLSTQLKNFNITKSEEEYLRPLVEEFQLSVTSLNNYLEDPQLFLYRNLLKVPEIKTKVLAMGTAIHSALENFYRDLINSKPNSLEKLLYSYEKSLRLEFQSKHEFDDTLQEGRYILTEWYKNQNEQFNIPIGLEYCFYGNDSYLNDIPLIAKIDKIEWIDKEAKTVRIIDYKTGSPASHGEILKPLDGGTESNYYRQLVFYKLIADITPSFPYKVIESQLEFIKPDNGKCRKECFEIPDDDIEKLKEIIVEVMSKIRELRF